MIMIGSKVFGNRKDEVWYEVIYFVEYVCVLQTFLTRLLCVTICD